jgi:hypothetical protein
MAKLLKLRRGTTTQHGSFTGAEGEVTVDTSKDVLVVNDGSTAGGHPLAAEDMSNVSSTSIVSAIGASALAGVKVQPNFGSQNVETTGTLASGNHTVTGNIVVSGTVDGADIAAMNTKLTGIDTGAKDDQTAAEIRVLVEAASDSNVFTNADHTKLNGIDTGAKDDQTAPEIRALGFFDTSNDGSGSGLDADVLDGQHGSYYTNASNISSGTLAAARVATLNQNTTGSSASCTGNAATATQLATARNISGASFNGTADITLNNSNITNGAGYTTYTSNQATNNNSNVTFGTVNCSSLTSSGDVTAFSDKRLKENIEVIPNALDKVTKLRGVTFKRTDEGASDKRMMGVIAQEVKDIVPEVVTKKESDGHYAVSYGNMVGLLIESIKELTAEVESLKKQIDGRTR